MIKSTRTLYVTIADTLDVVVACNTYYRGEGNPLRLGPGRLPAYAAAFNRRWDREANEGSIHDPASESLIALSGRLSSLIEESAA